MSMECSTKPRVRAEPMSGGEDEPHPERRANSRQAGKARDWHLQEASGEVGGQSGAWQEATRDYAGGFVAREPLLRLVERARRNKSLHPAMIEQWTAEMARQGIQAQVTDQIPVNAAARPIGSSAGSLAPIAAASAVAPSSVTNVAKTMLPKKVAMAAMDSG